DANDRTPTCWIMDPYSNYHHYACLGLSRCYEKLDNLPQALHFARLALEVHQYQTWCGTCSMSSRQRLRKRIERLEAQGTQPRRPGQEMVQPDEESPDLSSDERSSP